MSREVGEHVNPYATESVDKVEGECSDKQAYPVCSNDVDVVLGRHVAEKATRVDALHCRAQQGAEW